MFKESQQKSLLPEVAFDVQAAHVVLVKLAVVLSSHVIVSLFSILPLDVTKTKHWMNEPLVETTGEVVQFWFDALFERHHEKEH